MSLRHSSVLALQRHIACHTSVLSSEVYPFIQAASFICTSSVSGSVLLGRGICAASSVISSADLSTPLSNGCCTKPCNGFASCNEIVLSSSLLTMWPSLGVAVLVSSALLLSSAVKASTSSSSRTCLESVGRSARTVNAQSSWFC